MRYQCIETGVHVASFWNQLERLNMHRLASEILTDLERGRFPFAIHEHCHGTSSG